MTLPRERGYRDKVLVPHTEGGIENSERECPGRQEGNQENEYPRSQDWERLSNDAKETGNEFMSSGYSNKETIG